MALNYQTDDRQTFLNRAMFLGNGGCGYRLKPRWVFHLLKFLYQSSLDTSAGQVPKGPWPPLLPLLPGLARPQQGRVPWHDAHCGGLSKLSWFVIGCSHHGQVLSGQHLPRHGGEEYSADRDIIDPFVEVTTLN